MASYLEAFWTIMIDSSTQIWHLTLVITVPIDGLPLLVADYAGFNMFPSKFLYLSIIWDIE